MVWVGSATIMGCGSSKDGTADSPKKTASKRKSNAKAEQVKDKEILIASLSRSVRDHCHQIKISLRVKLHWYTCDYFLNARKCKSRWAFFTGLFSNTCRNSIISIMSTHNDHDKHDKHVVSVNDQNDQLNVHNCSKQKTQCSFSRIWLHQFFPPIYSKIAYFLILSTLESTSQVEVDVSDSKTNSNRNSPERQRATPSPTKSSPRKEQQSPDYDASYAGTQSSALESPYDKHGDVVSQAWLAWVIACFLVTQSHSPFRY